MALNAALAFPKQPLLLWGTLGPVVRAAVSAHPESILPAVIAVGTELAGAAVNLVPAGDSNATRVTGCTQDQGLLVLQVALRLVAYADRRSHGTSFYAPLKDGLYAQWMHSCFGVATTAGDSSVAQEVEQVVIDRCPPQGLEQQKSSSRYGVTSQAPVSEVRGLASLSSKTFYDSPYQGHVQNSVLTKTLRNLGVASLGGNRC